MDEALWDDLGNCVGGDTGLTENYLMDDCGVCYESDSDYDQNANTSKDLCGFVMVIIHPVKRDY